MLFSAIAGSTAGRGLVLWTRIQEFATWWHQKKKRKQFLGQLHGRLHSCQQHRFGCTAMRKWPQPVQLRVALGTSAKDSCPDPVTVSITFCNLHFKFVIQTDRPQPSLLFVYLFEWSIYRFLRLFGSPQVCRLLRRQTSHGMAPDPFFFCLPLSPEDKYGERRRAALLLPALHVCGGHGKHPQSVQRLSRHHPEDAPPPVRTLVRGITVEPVVLNSLLLTLSLDTTPHRVEEYTIEMSVSSLCLLLIV